MRAIRPRQHARAREHIVTIDTDLPGISTQEPLDENLCRQLVMIFGFDEG
jgi:hypothetical protein